MSRETFGESRSGPDKVGKFLVEARKIEIGAGSQSEIKSRLKLFQKTTALLH